jgi:integrase
MAQRAAKGEGRPYQRRSDGLSVVVVRDPDNRRRYLYGQTKAAVLDRRSEYLGGAAAGLSLASTKLTVGRQLEDWLADRRGKVRPSTWISYESHVRIHLAGLARIPLTRLRPADVRRLVRERELAGCAPRTIAYSLTILRMGIRQAVADGLIPRNAATGIAGPRVGRAELRILTVGQARAMLESAGDDTHGRLWTVLVGTGARLGEMLGLRRGDVDLERGTITIVGSLRPIDRRIRAEGEARLQLTDPKTAQGRRTIAVPLFVQAALRAELEEPRPRNLAGLVFTTPRGTALDPRNVSRRWEAFRAEYGLGAIRIHDLRHTAASLILANGGTLHDVMKLLGHANIAETANTYGHLVEERSRELAAGMDRLLAAR